MILKKPNTSCCGLFRYDRYGFKRYSCGTPLFLESLANGLHIFDNAFATGSNTPDSFARILADLHSQVEYFVKYLCCKAITPETPTVPSHLSEYGHNIF